MQLIDTHAHIEGFADSSRMVSNAKASGVVAVIAVSVDLETCKRTVGLADEYPDFIYPALGVHPQEAGKDNEAAFTFIEEHLDRCVAVGEIGLDYWAKVDKEAQNRAFSRLLDFALSRDLPVSIHSRGAWEECYLMAREKGTQKAVFHWFSGSTETLRRVIDSGYLVSATPALEYSKAHRAAIREAPIESLVLETDSPVKYHGKEAEPADVARTLHFVAELRDMVADDVASKTTMNARRLFSLG